MFSKGLRSPPPPVWALGLLLFSCRSVTRDLVFRAHELLSSDECERALNILDDVDEEERTARWYQTRASAQACRSSFREPDFFDSGIREIVAETFSAGDLSGLGSLGRSLAGFEISPKGFVSDSTVSPATVDDSEYSALMESISTLLNAGNPETPNFEGREEVFGEGSKANINIALQATYVTIATLGMFMNYFGNAADEDDDSVSPAVAAGSKGEGEGSNVCYVAYNDPFVTQILVGWSGQSCVNLGPCVTTDLGHPDLDLTTPAGLERACEGVIHFNGLINLVGVCRKIFQVAQVNSSMWMISCRPLVMSVKRPLTCGVLSIPLFKPMRPRRSVRQVRRRNAYLLVRLTPGEFNFSILRLLRSSTYEKGNGGPHFSDPSGGG